MTGDGDPGGGTGILKFWLGMGSVFPFLFGIVPFRSPSPFLQKNGTEKRNGTERFQF